jgi:hypothetical protein
MSNEVDCKELCEKMEVGDKLCIICRCAMKLPWKVAVAQKVFIKAEISEGVGFRLFDADYSPTHRTAIHVWKRGDFYPIKKVIPALDILLNAPGGWEIYGNSPMFETVGGVGVGQIKFGEYNPFSDVVIK